MPSTRLLFASLVLAMAAAPTADARRIRAPLPEPKPVVVPVEAPYSVTIVGENGRELDTYTHGRRFYVHGRTGQRYAIRVDNPTNRRIEAVVSVDGLDVIDGETANFRAKRGYVVPPRGSVTIDGFRTSTQAVAAFRFSSVSNSYAGKKGKARNVGVVGVAIFEEKARPTMVIPQPRRDLGRGQLKKRPAAPRESKPSASFDADDMLSESLGAGAPAPTMERSKDSVAPRRSRRERPGLGTEFGERRSSAVSFTKFVRANPRKPTSIAELRYNNAQGLQALGIRLRGTNIVDRNDIAIRESASAFPASPYDGSFAKAPR